jgi:hypothetical protein
LAQRIPYSFNIREIFLNFNFIYMQIDSPGMFWERREIKEEEKHLAIERWSVIKLIGPLCHFWRGKKIGTTISEVCKLVHSGRPLYLKCLHGIIDLVTSKVVEAVARFEASATAKAKIQKPERERRI